MLDNEEMNCLIESIDIFKEEQPDGRLLKCINFKFPVFYDGDENVTHIRWNSETTVEQIRNKITLKWAVSHKYNIHLFNMLYTFVSYNKWMHFRTSERYE